MFAGRRPTTDAAVDEYVGDFIGTRASARAGGGAGAGGGHPVEVRRQLLVGQMPVGHWVCSSFCGCSAVCLEKRPCPGRARGARGARGGRGAPVTSAESFSFVSTSGATPRFPLILCAAPPEVIAPVGLQIAARADRPRAMRERTVPTGTPRTSAISS